MLHLPQIICNADNALLSTLKKGGYRKSSRRSNPRRRSWDNVHITFCRVTLRFPLINFSDTTFPELIIHLCLLLRACDSVFYAGLMVCYKKIIEILGERYKIFSFPWGNLKKFRSFTEAENFKILCNRLTMQ